MTKSDRKQEAGSRGKAKSGSVSQRRLPWFGERFQGNLLVFLLALFLTIIIIPKGGFIPDYYAAGDIASRDVKAPRDLLIPDETLTEKKRQEAEDEVRSLYDFDPNAGQEIADRLIGAIRKLNSGLAKSVPREDLFKEIATHLGVNFGAEELGPLAELPIRAERPQAREAQAEPDALAVTAPESAESPPSAREQEFYQQLRKVIAQSLGPMVVGNLQLFRADRERGVVIRDLVSQAEWEETDLAAVVGVGDAMNLLQEHLREVRGLGARHRQALFVVIQKLLRPNLTFNKNETEARKRQAREAVTPVLFQVKKGEMVVREGERVSEDQLKKLKALREIGSDYSTLRSGLGLLLCILLLFYCTHLFARRNVRKYRPNNRDLTFLVMTFLGLFVLIKLAIFISTALESAFPYIDSATYYYVFPFAVGAMLVRIVLNSEVALVFAILSALVLGTLFGNSLVICFYALVGSLTGAHWVRQCKERSTLYRAGFRLSLINMALILGIHVMAGRAFDMQLLYKFGFGLAGGLVCAIIVNGTIPLIESAFKYTTDIKLLELANMNQPVLRELMIQAPGTYHHSIIVGNLVEAAAEAINANPLLARVAAYYHDVGKIRKPLYFVENMHGQDNRHDKLAPSMSALILMSHVKDGVELARESKLGEPLVDIIRQHHGTALIKFFYDKAKSKEDPGVQQVDERDYRYPGPKPQTREAALIMLADAVEAASRTLTDPNPARIQGMVQKIINNIFIDGQLDECELTLKDLHNIAKSFNRILAGIFHHRIDYPEPAYKERDKETGKRKNGEDTHREPAKPAKDKEVAPAKGSPEDLKRLGMS
ncbi:HD family phosphohydrolase [Desulfuromonas versatilis]|uniref:HD family phosphohydrolase n=1 Tax=Desulfuromonas versatilis TaxID=2802975 RepID=A0ABN6DYL6_9BACT|nr:HDIG domain-containing metalloprotein [Desulfuromonas versatilis]BCR05222.1 HD family phosphohydrolase [Desulfuromonas versatilis]